MMGPNRPNLPYTVVQHSFGNASNGSAGNVLAGNCTIGNIIVFIAYPTTGSQSITSATSTMGTLALQTNTDTGSAYPAYIYTTVATSAAQSFTANTPGSAWACAAWELSGGTKAIAAATPTHNTTTTASISLGNVVIGNAAFVVMMDGSGVTAGPGGSWILGPNGGGSNWVQYQFETDYQIVASPGILSATWTGALSSGEWACAGVVLS